MGFFLFAFSFGSFAQTFDLIVAQNGSGNYTTVQAAINAAPIGRTSPFTIFIKNGTYRERVTIPANKPFLQLTGESVTNTRIAFNQANVPSFPGNTSTIIINASDITAVNITFENFWGESPQALALYTTGDRIAFKNCRFLGGQDTVQLNSQTGNRNYFKDCYIDGVVDFIFGAARGVFENCVVYARTRRDGGNSGYITAANTQPGQPYGFVFRNCIIPENRGTTAYTLGRPWQNDLGSTTTNCSHTKVVWLNTTMSSSIKPAGWQLWDVGTVTSVIQYAEYKSRDFSGNLVNISQRVPWSIQLADADTVNYTRAAVFGNWNPCNVLPNFCASAPSPIAVSNFLALKGTATVPSTLQWNISWPISGVQHQLFRSSMRRGTYAPIYTTSTITNNVNFGTTDPTPAPGTTYYYYVRASKPGLAAHVTDTLQISSTPTIMTTGSFHVFLQGGSQPSAAQNILVSGENLTAGLVITPPANFQVSVNGGSTWSSSATLTPNVNGSIASTTLSVRLNAASVGSYTGSLGLTSTSAATVSLFLDGTAQAAVLPQSFPLLWWPMARTNQDSTAVRSSAVTASVPTFRKLVISSGSAASTILPYSTRYGQAFAPTTDGGWTPALGGPGGNLNRTFYEQFTVMPSGTTPVRVDSVSFTSYVTSSTSNTKMAVMWSRSGFATDSADVSGGKGPTGMLPGTANANFTTPVFLGTQATYHLAFAGASGTTLQPSQRLTFRVYFSCGSTTTTTRFATLKNVLVKGEPLMVTGTQRVANTTLQLYPNPTITQALLVHPVATPESAITLYSSMGQRVATIACSISSQQTLLDLQHLASGQYLVRYSSGTTQFTAKLLKQ